jgi:hypothetical protein
MQASKGTRPDTYTFSMSHQEPPRIGTMGRERLNKGVGHLAQEGAGGQTPDGLDGLFTRRISMMSDAEPTRDETNIVTKLSPQSGAASRPPTSAPRAHHAGSAVTATLNPQS